MSFLTDLKTRPGIDRMPPILLDLDSDLEHVQSYVDYCASSQFWKKRGCKGSDMAISELRDKCLPFKKIWGFIYSGRADPPVVEFGCNFDFYDLGNSDLRFHIIDDSEFVRRDHRMYWEAKLKLSETMRNDDQFGRLQHWKDETTFEHDSDEDILDYHVLDCLPFKLRLYAMLEDGNTMRAVQLADKILFADPPQPDPDMTDLTTRNVLLHKDNDEYEIFALDFDVQLSLTGLDGVVTMGVLEPNDYKYDPEIVYRSHTRKSFYNTIYANVRGLTPLPSS